VDLFLLQEFYIPVNENRNHWLVIVVSVAQKRIWVYDPLGKNPSEGMYATEVLRFLQDEHRDKKQVGLPDPSAWTLGDLPGEDAPLLPIQPNFNDCGVYATSFIAHSVKQIPFWPPKSGGMFRQKRFAADLRHNFAASIMCQRLLVAAHGRSPLDMAGDRVTNVERAQDAEIGAFKPKAKAGTGLTTTRQMRRRKRGVGSPRLKAGLAVRPLAAPRRSTRNGSKRIRLNDVDSGRVGCSYLLMGMVYGGEGFATEEEVRNAVAEKKMSERAARDTYRCMGMERLDPGSRVFTVDKLPSPCGVDTVDQDKAFLQRQDRHLICDANNLNSEKEWLEKVGKFDVFYLDYCWNEVGYWRNHVREGFYIQTLPLLATMLTKEGRIILPAAADIFVRLVQYEEMLSAHYRIRFSPPSESDGFLLVKATDSIDGVTSMECLGGKSRKQETKWAFGQEFPRLVREELDILSLGKQHKERAKELYLELADQRETCHFMVLSVLAEGVATSGKKIKSKFTKY
jgi:hypothetical protein